MEPLKLKLAPYDHIIWDWNGTIIADVDHVWKATQVVLDRYDQAPISLEQYRRDFFLPLEAYYQSLGFDTSRVPYQEVAHAFQDEYTRRIPSMSLFAGMVDLLVELKEQGKTNILLSASSQTALEQSLAHFGITHHFEHVYGVANRLAQGKAERGLELLRDTGFSRERCLLVGDTDHDLEVGTAMGVEVLLIADGHQSLDRLQSVHHNVLASRY